MTTQRFLDIMDSGDRTNAGSAVHLKMYELSQEAIKITMEMNNSYHTPDELHELMEKLTGRKVGERFGMFPPFYTDCGKNIHIGSGVFINSGCKFQDQGGIYIGDGALIGHNTVLATLNHGMLPDERGDLIPRPIHIGKNVWIGSNSTILSGVTIGDNAVIGAGSVVTKDIPENMVAVGSPAKVIRSIYDQEVSVMKEIYQGFFKGERALFQGADLKIYDSIFDDGESPLKHSRNVELEGCMFKWKYPLWYSENIVVRDCFVFEMGRAGIWYTNNIDMTDTLYEAPKGFRRCDGVSLTNVNFMNAAETLWHCKNVTMKNITAKGDYFAMNSESMEIDGLDLVGNYSFDGCKNIVIRNSKLLSKDAFWNSENITVYDSFISGEYLGWNSKNLTLINCTIESLQGMCYIDDLVMKNCKLINTTLAFEYSTVDAEITSRIDSVMNPTGGIIRAESIDELIIQEDKIDPGKTKIICRDKNIKAV